MSPVLPILRGDNKVVLRPFRRLAISSSVSSVLSQKYSGPAYSASTKGFRSFKFFFAIMIVLSCKLRDGLSVTEVPRCKGKQNSRKSKTFGCFFEMVFEVRGARYEVRGQSLYAAVSSQILMMTCMAFCMDWMLTNS